MPKPPSVETTEVRASPADDRCQRRAPSGKEKPRILGDADARKGRGEVAALRRREGIYRADRSDQRRRLRAYWPAPSCHCWWRLRASRNPNLNAHAEPGRVRAP